VDPLVGEVEGVAVGVGDAAGEEAAEVEGTAVLGVVAELAGVPDGAGVQAGSKTSAAQASVALLRGVRAEVDTISRFRRGPPGHRPNQSPRSHGLGGSRRPKPGAQ
jgi:hypothetical protein